MLSSDEEAQRNIAPFLSIPVLRRIVQTLSNDERGDFALWACNPRVLGMLRECKRLLDEGRVTEEEIERTMLAQITQAGNPAGRELKEKTALKARLTTEQLIPALNEHLEERCAAIDRENSPFTLHAMLSADGGPCNKCAWRLTPDPARRTLSFQESNVV